MKKIFCERIYQKKEKFGHQKKNYLFVSQKPEFFGHSEWKNLYMPNDTPAWRMEHEALVLHGTEGCFRAR